MFWINFIHILYWFTMNFSTSIRYLYRNIVIDEVTCVEKIKIGFLKNCDYQLLWIIIMIYDIGGGPPPQMK